MLGRTAGRKIIRPGLVIPSFVPSFPGLLFQDYDMFDDPSDFKFSLTRTTLPLL